MISSPARHQIHFHVDPIFYDEVARLPWRVPFSEWHMYGVRLLNIHREKIVDLFPGKTAAELYIEIMTNKYFLSEKIGKDAGMIQAMHDYAEKFGVTNSFLERMKSASDKLLSIFTSNQ